MVNTGAGFSIGVPGHEAIEALNARLASMGDVSGEVHRTPVGWVLLGIVATIVGDLYSLQERGRVQGFLASVWAVSAVVGPADVHNCPGSICNLILRVDEGNVVAEENEANNESIATCTPPARP